MATPPKPPGLAVDTASMPAAKPGVGVVMLTTPGAIPPLPTDPRDEGAFRLMCNWSKMSFDDPIVFPGQPGASHLHTFFGNTGIDAYTTVDNIRSKGYATCRGGTINLSGYWVPTMVDTATGKPLAPRSLIVYYKTGGWSWMGDNSVMQPIPKGLRMITGDAGATVPGTLGEFSCFMPTNANRDGTWGRSIPQCPAGDAVRMRISFPQCWDGINLDSPDHKSHMAMPERYTGGNPYLPFRCPLSHPVVLPSITYTVDYDVGPAVDTAKWRLSSDTYDASLPGGYSIHADWMNGWDHDISDLWGMRCMRDRRECGSANLGDGRGTIEFQGN